MKSWEIVLRNEAQGIVVDKGVSVKYDGIRLPRFISEYLLSEFMLRYGVEGLAVQKMAEYIDSKIPQSAHVSEWHNRLRNGEKCSVIDNVRVADHIELISAEPQAFIPSIGVRKARIAPEILRQHPRLLREGLWGKVTLAAHGGGVSVVDFKPFQLSEVSLEKYAQLRTRFSTPEWYEILVSTIGLSPDHIQDQRSRLILLTRLLPLVQSQTYMIEVGPPGTGKTFVLDKLSTRSFVVSGSKVSPAQLFYDLKTRAEGLLRRYSALLLDEIDKVTDRELSEEIVNKLLKYMESGTFDRGKMEFQSDASLVLVGNISREIVQGRGCLGKFPRKLTHEAFLDRLNGLVPGWELNPVTSSEKSLTRTWGFSADFFSEVLEQLRNVDWVPELRQRVAFGGCSIRDEKAVLRTFSGFAKLVHPDRNFGDDSLRELLCFAVELRQRLLDESSVLNGGGRRAISANLY